jgi:hypothetical protein
MKSLFVSRSVPVVSTTDLGKSLLDQLQSSSLTYIGLKTKFQTCASFHVSVTEEDFPSIKNMGVWPNGSSIAPFYGRGNPYQIYSPGVSYIPVTVASAFPRDTEKLCESKT